MKNLLPKVLTRSHINVPLALLQSARNDRLWWGLVALSVAMKAYSPSSCYILRSEHRFRRDFHLGADKAKRLLHAILDEGHPLFRVKHCQDGSTQITAVSYKRDYGYYAMFSHKSQQYRSRCMTAVEVTITNKVNIRVSALERQMRLLLMKSVISARNRADELQTKGCPLSASASHAARTILSIPYLADVTGRSQRSIIRMSKEAQRSGSLQAIKYPLERCCDDMSHPTIDVTGLIRIGNLGFSRRCNDYWLLHESDRRAFKHIIYGHRSRLTMNACTLQAGQVLSQTDLHALYD